MPLSEVARLHSSGLSDAGFPGAPSPEGLLQPEAAEGAGHIPPKEPGHRTLVEVTRRTVQGLFLLRPGSDLNRILLGVLGKAQQRTRTALHSIDVLSGHLHMLLSVLNAQVALIPET